MSEAQGIGRASAIMAAGTVVSRLLGFVRSIVLAAAVGVTASAAADAFAVAIQVPNNVFVLVSGGVLNAVLVPQLIRAGVHRDGEGGAYVNRLVTISLVMLGALTLVATIAAPALVLVYAGSGMIADPAMVALAFAFAYWCMPQIFFFGLYTVLSQVLNARSRFGPAMWSPVLNNVVAIAGLSVFLAIWGTTTSADGWSPAMIAVLAGTSTLGVAAQALVLFWSWRRAGIRFRFDFHWRGTGLRAVGKAAGWTFGMLVVMQLGGILSTQVALLATGVGASVAAIQTAWLVFMLPHSIVAVSLTTVYFTRMSTHATEGDLERFGADLRTVLRVIGVTNVLAAVALAVVAVPFASVFEPEAHAAVQLAQVIIAYMPGLVGFGLLFVVQRAFFALEDTRTPFFLTTGYVIVYSAGSLACILLPLELIAVGIAVVTSVGTTVHALVAAWLLRRRIGAFGFGGVLMSHLRFLLAAAPATAAGVGMLWVVEHAPALSWTSGRVGALVEMAIVGAVVALVYAAGLWLVRAPELRDLVGAVAGRLRRR